MSYFIRTVIIGFLATFTGLWATDVTLSISNSGPDFIEIYMESTETVAGFQFVLNDDPDAFNVTGASGGLAEDAGFMLSTNAEGLVLGFALMTIPPSSGVLTNLAIDAFGDYSQLTIDIILFSTPYGSELDAEFVQPGGYYEWGELPPEDVAHFTLSDGTAEAGESGTMEILLENTMEVAGFQFMLVDDPELITLTDVVITDRTTDFMVSFGDYGMVLGFSLSGAIIAPGTGPIAIATYTAGAIGGTAEVSYADIILSDPSGTAIETTSEGGSFTITGGYIPPPTVTILSPEDGGTVYGQNLNVSLLSENLNEGDHYNVYFDEALHGAIYEDQFTIPDVAFGTHSLTVTIADSDNIEYENPEATATVNFENIEQPQEGYTVILGSNNVIAGESVEIDISLVNEGVIGGFQLKIIDFPNYLDMIDISTTERTAGFQMQYNEQLDGSVMLVGFDMSLEGIAPGTGSIMVLTYLSTGIYDAEIELSIGAGESILSDLVGNPIEFESENGLIIVDGEDAPPIFAPENLNAIGGWEMVSLTWTHPEPWDVDGYYIYRDGW